MSITFNIQDFGDNNSLQIPPLSPLDSRITGHHLLRPISLSVSDKDIESAKSSHFSNERREKSILHRPVSDQGLHEPVKKEVSWHSKIPTSVQTLSCVEDTASTVDIEKFGGEEKQSQSQPILGTLESNSRNKHVCRHTYSVRQSYSCAKENSKVWNLKRSSSEDKPKTKDKFIPLSLKTINVNSSTTTTTDSNCSSTTSALCDSRLDVLDTSREDAFSLIDWEEDEKACDAEVQNIIGDNDEEEDDDEKPTPSLPLQTSLNFEKDTPVQDSQEKPDSLDSILNEPIDDNSTLTLPNEPLDQNSKGNMVPESRETENGDAGHSSDSIDVCETEIIEVISETYADTEHNSESNCDVRSVKSNDDTLINIPLEHLSVPLPRVMNDGNNLLAVPSAAQNTSPHLHERRKEESHL